MIADETTYPRVLDARRMGKGNHANRVYVGRPTIWGNPFSHKHATSAAVVVGSINEAVRYYESWLAGTSHQDLLQEQRLKILEQLPSLRGKDLVCWGCRPRCHASVLLLLANKESS